MRNIYQEIRLYGLKSIKSKNINMLYLIEHKTFPDNRGSYTPISLETMNKKWNQCCISINNNKFTFRGMHYQTDPAQTKYIKVIQGSIIDFALDLETGQLDSIHVDNNHAVLVPNNMAHGFLTLEPNTIISYLVEGEWNPDSEHSIVWNSIPELRSSIESIIGQDELIISEKDRVGK
jgi:dTDP-4-dehydrorhamnose 3,5-epimerase